MLTFEKKSFVELGRVFTLSKAKIMVRSLSLLSGHTRVEIIFLTKSICMPLMSPRATQRVRTTSGFPYCLLTSSPRSDPNAGRNVQLWPNPKWEKFYGKKFQYFTYFWVQNGQVCLIFNSRKLKKLLHFIDFSPYLKQKLCFQPNLYILAILRSIFFPSLDCFVCLQKSLVMCDVPYAP